MSIDNTKLLSAARELLQRPDPRTAGIWPRASALLARQALEGTLDEMWRHRAPGVEQCSMRAQMLCLASYLGDDDLSARVYYAWGGLSRACHQHAYDLSPTATELTAWFETVDELIGSVEAGRNAGR